MREKILKNQVVVFGQFNFPPIPEVTISLMQSFAAHGFMPMVIKQLDPSTGNTAQRIALTKDNTLQITFGQNRIDFTRTLPVDEEPLEKFVDLVIEYLGCLQSRNLEFSRIAVVHEQLSFDMSTEQQEKLRNKFAPAVPVGSIEWIFRWVNPQKENDEILNVCFEAARLKGMFETNVGTESFDGVKFLHDISTSPENLMSRFNVNNVSAGFGKLIEVYKRQTESNNVKIA